MENGRHLLGKPESSPFSPHFGASPHSLVGRSELLSELGSGLATGPRDARFTSVVMGVRGSGKTALLNEIEDRASSSGWVVISMDASTPGLLDRIISSIDRAEHDYEALDLGSSGDKIVEHTVGMRLGPLAGKLSAQEHFRSRHALDLRERLAFLAAAAQRYNTSVLLTVDELHAVDRLEGRRLSSDIQHIARRQQMPLAFIGAGLSEMKNTLLRDRKMTFFHRCEPFDMAPLDFSDSLVGLSAPITDGGGSIAEDALALAAEEVQGSPYKLQLIGDMAWKLAGAPHKPITVEAARQAAAAAGLAVDQRVSVPAWHDLSAEEKRMLMAIARLGGHGCPRDVAQRAETTAKRSAEVMSRMLNAGYLVKPASGAYAISGLVPRAVVLREGEHHETGRAHRAAGVFAAAAKCRKWMPRAEAYCVLASGHSGRCRSR
ncbi:MAG: ATP-binding protein [Acidimicrobiaceae bacterium]|nr:ATP-binding protein [Acidimicrobiaceae bacterium]